ncbi:MAG: hypothetical protein AAF664_04605 [Planctomycetota bacterium]
MARSEDRFGEIAKTLRERFAIDDEHLCRWFNEGCTLTPSATSQFIHFVEFDEFVDDRPPAIWAGLMPCDFLPVVGNGRGDFIGLRTGQLDWKGYWHWFHGGGDILPWGRTLSEALLFDSLSPIFQRTDRPLAIDPGERISAEEVSVSSAIDDRTRFALTQLSRHLIEVDCTYERAWELMKCNQWCDTAVQFHDLLQANGAAEMLFPGLERIESPLAWIGNWMGDAGDARGYLRALGNSSFTDQSVRLEQAWDISVCHKYAGSKLIDLVDAERISLDENDEEYLHCLSAPIKDRFSAISSLHLQRSLDWRAAGDLAAALREAYLAGWDIGCDQFDGFKCSMELVIDIAQECGQEDLSAVTKLHLHALGD